MPNWWPWGRPRETAPQPAAPAVTAKPAWRQLPVIQRTVDEIETTAQLSGFTASLTTSQNPALTGQLELLSAGHPDQLPVLEVVRDSVGAPAEPAAASPAPTRQPRRWAPNMPIAQRAHLGSVSTVTAVQRTADFAATPPEPPMLAELQPIEAPDSAESLPHSFVEAPKPTEDRMLEVATDREIGVAEPQPVTPIAEEPITHRQTGTVDDGVVPIVTTETEPPGLACAPSVVSGAPSVVSAPPSVLERPQPTVPLERTVANAEPFPQHASAQRAVSERDSPQRPSTSARPIPIVKPTDSPGAQPRSSQPHLQTTPVQDVAATLQRAADPSPAQTNAIAADRSSHSTPTPLSTAPTSESKLPAAPAPEAHRTVAVTQPVAAQRITSPMKARESTPRTGRSVAPDAVVPSPYTESSAQAAGVQRLPIVGVRPEIPEAIGQGRRETPVPPTVQRSPTGGLPRLVASRSADRVTGSPRYADDPPGIPPSRSPEPTLQHVFPPPPGGADVPRQSTGGVVQRFALPMVQPRATSTPAGLPTAPKHSDVPIAPVAPILQRSAAPVGGRVVVLPPVRSSGSHPDHADSPSDTPSTPARSVLFESARPMSLQRMFEHTAQHVDDASDSGPSELRPSSSNYRTSEAPGYDMSTNTITFPSATVQREPEAAPSAPAPAPAPAANMTAAPQAPSPPGGGDVDELVNKLYDPLAARLRAELWLDRERAGVLMDLGR